MLSGFLSSALAADKSVLFETLPIPPDFPQILNDSASSSQTGVHFIGDERFLQNDIDIDLSTFSRRVFTSHDDICLSILALIAIVLVTQIVQVVLMRTSISSPLSTPARLFFSVVLSQFLQFRLPFRFINTTNQCVSRYYQPQPRSSQSSSNGTSHSNFSPVQLSIIAFLSAISLFVLHVLLLFVTFPRPVQSSSEQYGLQGVQPVFSDFNVGMKMLAATKKKECTSPFIIMNGRNKKKRLGYVEPLYTLNVCVKYEETVPRNRSSSVSSSETNTITISSALHRAGSDYEVVVGDRSITLSTRVEIRCSSRDGLGKKGFKTRNILFHTEDGNTSPFSNSRFLQRSVIHESRRFACRNYFDQPSTPNTAINSTQNFCNESRGVKPTSWKVESRPVSLWGDIVENVSTISSTFNSSDIPSPFEALRVGIAALVPSSVIYAVAQDNINLDLESIEENKEGGLVIQWLPAVGVGLYTVFDVVLLFLFLILKWMLQPISTNFMAWKYAQRNRFLNMNSFFKFQQQIRRDRENTGSRSTISDLDSFQIDPSNVLHDPFDNNASEGRNIEGKNSDFEGSNDYENQNRLDPHKQLSFTTNEYYIIPPSNVDSDT